MLERFLLRTGNCGYDVSNRAGKPSQNYFSRVARAMSTFKSRRDIDSREISHRLRYAPRYGDLNRQLCRIFQCWWYDTEMTLLEFLRSGDGKYLQCHSNICAPPFVDDYNGVTLRPRFPRRWLRVYTFACACAQQTWSHLYKLQRQMRIGMRATG